MASAPPAPRPTVSESALDFLLLETVRGYRDKGEAGRRAVEAMGYRVGTQLAERCVACARRGSPPAHLPSRRLPRPPTPRPPSLTRTRAPPADPLPRDGSRRRTKDRARFTEPTEAILFVCKEFWPVFKKRVDNLKTTTAGRSC